MKKINVKNWNVESELVVLDWVLQLVDYQLSMNDWGRHWYTLGEWRKVNACERCWDGWKYAALRVWILNNRLLREKIGVFDCDSCYFVSGICLIGK